MPSDTEEMKMRVLLLDSSNLYPANPLFAEALAQLAREHGFQHRVFDEACFLKTFVSTIPHRIFYKLAGRRPITYWSLNRSFLKTALSFKPNLIIVAKGMYLSPATLRAVKRGTGAILVNYATDDPFNTAVNNSDLLSSIHIYDIYACTKKAIREDIQKAGCVNVVYVPFGYKPNVHFPEAASSPAEAARFSSDVAFIGGCDRDRSSMVRDLLRRNPDVTLNLYGNFWDRHLAFRRHHRGWVLGRNYRLAVCGAKVALNLVRRANRDGHVMRTFEIPACGAFMLTDRTDEQGEFLAEDKEAAFFSSVEEMNDKIRYYLNHDAERQRIAQAGYRRITGEPNTYKDRLKTIFRMIDG